MHSLESGERDPEDWLTLSPTELLEHTGEQGWDEIFAAVREKQISREGEVNPTAVGFPLPDDERSLADWLELAPADMYKETLRLDWDEIIEAIQTLQQINPRGHLAPMAEPESVLRGHLVARMRRLFDPGMIYQEAQLRASSTLTSPAAPSREGEAMSRSSSTESIWSGGIDSQGQKLDYAQGQKHATLRSQPASGSSNTQ